MYEIAGLPRDAGAVTVRIDVEDGDTTYVHEVSIDPAAGDRRITLGEPAYVERVESE